MGVFSRLGPTGLKSPTMESQRAPAYGAKGKVRKALPKAQVNNISDYVKHNLSDNTSKPRGGEHR